MSLLRARIISIEDFSALRSQLSGIVVATSGGFDPIHPGHISCIQESKQHGDTLVVVVNGDAFLRAKKGKPFQDLHTRCLIVSAIAGVDYVLPFEIDNDMTVSRALEAIRPHVFTKGGDRTNPGSEYDLGATIPEWPVCEKYNIKVVTGVGIGKKWSSSWFLNDWGKHINNQTHQA